MFNSSNAQTEEHKNFIEENDQERKANMAWAKAAFDKYEEMMKDFKQFKESTNVLFSKLSDQYRDEVLTMKATVTN